ncbi:hypothetical protein DSCO28_36560 [Desulfosarcina ovata subsp. sediminis]|uniref:Uncharacterized protein n=2 Tax=Desulfosarcina ovata TaxID=83564 RepID=A0A5K7ZSA1_9BACT|nr:hypothetical protein DSCO28_36560 [Desulfosarcina ovata subsp. sediminis]
MILLFLGCAGQPIKGVDQGPNPLRGMVHERFSRPISDPSIFVWLNRSDLHLDAHDQQLECEILHELVNIEVKDWKSAVDRLWETNREFRKMVSDEGNWDGYEYPLAEIYYLLSAVQPSSWEKDTAEKLYQQHLKQVQPNELTGYALHFYIQALLLNGKIETAIPFLPRLGQFKPADYFLDDLAYALSCSLSVKDTEHSLKILELILETGITDHPDKVDQIMCALLPDLNQAGIIEQVVQALSSFVDQHSVDNEYQFVPLMQEYYRAFIISKRQPNRVTVQIQVILASKKDAFVDHRLVGIIESLNSDLNFRGFRLLENRHFQLMKKESGRMPIPNGYRLTVKPVELSEYDSKMNVAIHKGGNCVFNTLVKTLDDGVTVIGGPKIDDGMILLRIKTDFYSKGV